MILGKVVLELVAIIITKEKDIFLGPLNIGF